MTRCGQDCVFLHSYWSLSYQGQDFPVWTGMWQLEAPGSLPASLANREEKAVSFSSPFLIPVRRTTEKDSFLACLVHGPLFGPISVDKDEVCDGPAWMECVCKAGREHGSTERGRPTRKEGGGCYQKSERVTEQAIISGSNCLPLQIMLTGASLCPPHNTQRQADIS